MVFYNYLILTQQLNKCLVDSLMRLRFGGVFSHAPQLPPQYFCPCYLHLLPENELKMNWNRDLRIENGFISDGNWFLMTQLFVVVFFLLDGSQHLKMGH